MDSTMIILNSVSFVILVAYFYLKAKKKKQITDKKELKEDDVNA